MARRTGTTNDGAGWWARRGGAGARARVWGRGCPRHRETAGGMVAPRPRVVCGCVPWMRGCRPHGDDRWGRRRHRGAPTFVVVPMTEATRVARGLGPHPNVPRPCAAGRSRPIRLLLVGRVGRLLRPPHVLLDLALEFLRLSLDLLRGVPGEIGRGVPDLPRNLLRPADDLVLDALASQVAHLFPPWWPLREQAICPARAGARCTAGGAPPAGAPDTGRPYLSASSRIDSSRPEVRFLTKPRRAVHPPCTHAFSGVRCRDRARPGRHGPVCPTGRDRAGAPDHPARGSVRAQRQHLRAGRAAAGLSGPALRLPARGRGRALRGGRPGAADLPGGRPDPQPTGRRAVGGEDVLLHDRAAAPDDQLDPCASPGRLG